MSLPPKKIAALVSLALAAVVVIALTVVLLRDGPVARVATGGVVGSPSAAPTTPTAAATATPPPSGANVFYSLTNGTVAASDTGNGTAAWRQPFPFPASGDHGFGNFATSLSVDQDIVFVVAPVLAPKADVFGLDAKTGQTRWSYTRDGPCTVQTSPGLADLTDHGDGNFYVVTGGGKVDPSACRYTSHDLVVLDEHTGATRWTVKNSTLIATGPKVAVVYNGSSMGGRRSTDGLPLWVGSLPGAIQQVLASGDTLYVNYGNLVETRSMATGKTLWSWSYYGSSYSSIYLQTALNGDLYVLIAAGSTIRLRRIVAGKDVWSVQGSVSGTAVDASYFTQGSRLFRRSVQPLAFAEMNPANGSIIWRAQSPTAGAADSYDSQSATPFFVLGASYQYGDPNDGKNALTAISPDVASANWTQHFADPIYSFHVLPDGVLVSTFAQIVDTGTPEPVNAGGTPTTIHVPGPPFTVYLLDKKTGAIRWQHATDAPAFGFTR